MKFGLKLKRATKVKGGVEGVSRGVVFGWAVTPELASATVRITLDGVTLGTTEASLPRPDIAIAAPVEHRCGFRFDLRPFVKQLKGQTLTVEVEGSDRLLSPTPMKLTNDSGWGSIDAIDGVEVRGWAVCAHPGVETAMVEIRIDGELAGCVETSLLRTDLRAIGVSTRRSGFSFLIPSRWHDGATHMVTARVKGNESDLRGGPLPFSCQVEGHVDAFSANLLSGWICNLRQPTVPLAFDVWVNDRKVLEKVRPRLPRHDVEHSLFPQDKTAGHPVGFSLQLPEAVEWTGVVDRVRLCTPGTEDELLHMDVAAVSRLEMVLELERMITQRAEAANAAKASDPRAMIDKLLHTQLLPQVLSLLRSGGSAQALLLNVPASRCAATAPVDVIVPVYKGYEETLDCIRSVLAAQDGTPMELIVINDRSPDPRLSAELRRLAALKQFTLIENEKNLGFVATVNKGMGCHGDRDVVLLNSDTVVPKGWLQAIRRAAYAAPNIATVTPLSNRATIFSLPRTCIDNDMPLGLDVDQVHAMCAASNPGVIVDVPTAMGFCMYIRRAALDQVGLFDEEKWAKGYAEENDFSLRAQSMGWRNVAACDAFVQHLGSVSFDTEKAPRVAENLAKLNAIYPDYPQRVQRFLRTDPLALPRGRVNARLFQRLASGYVLFVTHGLGGGTDTAIKDLVRIHADSGRKVLILRSMDSGKLHLAPASREQDLVTEYPGETDVEALAAQLREVNVQYVHFHHTLGFSKDIWRLPELLSVPYEVMLHDFYLACPRINMIDESGVYCGRPSVDSCERCIGATALTHGVGPQLREIGGTVREWRQFHEARLQGARAVVAPSEDTAQHMRAFFPALRVQAVPHPEPAFRFQPRAWAGDLPFKVAVLGAIGPHKGSELLLRCARYARGRDLPIRFVIIGYTDRDADFEALPNVEITGRYTAEELPDIVDATGCNAALFLSVWPETYSYTLSEAWRLGLHPIAFDLGAPAERIRAMQAGTVIPFTQDPKAIMDAILEYMDGASPDLSSIAQSQLTSAEGVEV